jgi:hypothetical protein
MEETSVSPFCLALKLTARGVVQVVECLSSKFEHWVQTPGALPTPRKAKKNNNKKRGWGWRSVAQGLPNVWREALGSILSSEQKEEEEHFGFLE